MFDKSPKSPPPAINAAQPTDSELSLLSVHDVVETPSAASGLGPATRVALEALKNILEGVDTLPCVKYIAGIGVKILEIVDEVQTNKEDLKNISLRAKDIIVAVAIACKGAEEYIAKQLENDLKQLTGTMNDILAFIKELASRKGYKKILYKMDDATTVKTLDTQLTHAFQIFEIQCNVSLRILQQKVFRQVEHIPFNSQPPLIKNCPLRVPEGIYIIRNALDGCVIEAEHSRLTTAKRNAHIYVAPSHNGASPYQLWTIFSRSGKEFDYTIRNFATGVVLDVFCMRSEDGTQVIGHSPFGGGHQTWAIYGTRQATSFDYCTIRSYGPQTALDSKCAINSKCDYLHASRIRSDEPHPCKEWSLIRFPISDALPRPSPSPTPASGGELHNLYRRRFYLQNVASGGYATVTGLEEGMDDPNVVIEHSMTASTPWYFMHTTKDPDVHRHDDMFAIVAGDPPTMGTLDHWGERHISVSSERFWPSNRYHMWKAIPRDGVFSFKNFATNRLLCQSRVTRLVDTAPMTAFDNPACKWKLFDSSSGEVSQVLYDSTLSILPPDISGPPPEPTATQESTQRLTLRTEPASAEHRRKFLDGLKYEHDLMHEMLNSGYTSLVVAPLVVAGWRKGKVSQVKIADEESSFGLPKFKATTDYGTCKP